MKVGDLIALRNLDPSWGNIALITNIVVNNSNTGTIFLLTPTIGNCSIPWHKGDVYVEEVLSESG